MSTPQNKKVLQQLMKELQSTRSPNAKVADLIAKLYPGGLNKFEKDWHTWIKHGGARVLGPNMEEILKRVQEMK